MGIRWFWLLLAIATVVHKCRGEGEGEAECGGDLSQLSTCVSNIFEEAKKERDDKAAESSRGKIACFTDNGCPKPSFGSGGASLAAQGECVKKIFETDMKETLLTCIQKDVPSFSFPDNFWTKIEERGNLLKKLLKKGDPLDNLHAICDLRERLLDACPEGDPRAKAKACLIHHHENRNKGKRNYAKDFKQIKACVKEMKKECLPQVQGIRDSLCSCALEQLEDEDLKKKIFVCGGGEGSELDAEQADKVVKTMTIFFCGKQKKAEASGSDSEKDK